MQQGSVRLANHVVMCEITKVIEEVVRFSYLSRFFLHLMNDSVDLRHLIVCAGFHKYQQTTNKVLESDNRRTAIRMNNNYIISKGVVELSKHLFSREHSTVCV